MLTLVQLIPICAFFSGTSSGSKLFLLDSQGVRGQRGGGGDKGVLQRHAGHSAALQVREAAVRRDPRGPPRRPHVPGVWSAPSAQTVR